MVPHNHVMQLASDPNLRFRGLLCLWPPRTVKLKSTYIALHRYTCGHINKTIKIRLKIVFKEEEEKIEQWETEEQAFPLGVEILATTTSILQT